MVIQEERSAFWGGDRIGNYEKRIHMNTCLIMNGYGDKICLNLQIQKHCEW